jgi:hypothetical protein
MADLTSVPWDQFPANPDPQDLISRNFRFYELFKSEYAERNHIDNHFRDPKHLRAAVNLCRHVLQPLRDAFGSFSPNSVYRSQAVERGCKNMPADWVSPSQHAVGEACDVEIPGKSTLELANWAAAHLAFDEIICECYNPAEGKNSGWVHISLRTPGGVANRHRRRSYIYDPAKRQYAYVDGLTASFG